MTHNPTESVERSVKVIVLYNRSKDRYKVSSIREAIGKVKEEKEGKIPVCLKIVTRDDEVVYNSKRNGKIEKWEREWEREKQILSGRDEDTHSCPHGVLGCTSEDFCFQCKMDNKIEEQQSW